MATITSPRPPLTNRFAGTGSVQFESALDAPVATYERWRADSEFLGTLFGRSPGDTVGDAQSQDAEVSNECLESRQQIRLIPYARAIFNLLWSAFRYPRLTTEIDLATGEVIRHY